MRKRRNQEVKGNGFMLLLLIVFAILAIIAGLHIKDIKEKQVQGSNVPSHHRAE